MSNPNFDRSRGEIQDEKILNLSDFNFASIVWENPDPDNEDMAEAQIKIKIGDKVYRCKFEKLVGVPMREERFELFDNANLAEYALQGSVQFDMDTENDDACATTSIFRNPKQNKKDSTLPFGTGIIFYRKMLDYIKEESKKYKQGLMHLVVHDPNLGLSPEKWNEIFEPLLIEKGYQNWC